MQSHTVALLIQSLHMVSLLYKLEILLGTNFHVFHDQIENLYLQNFVPTSIQSTSRSCWELTICRAWHGDLWPVLWSSLYKERGEWLQSAFCDHQEPWCSPHCKYTAYTCHPGWNIFSIDSLPNRLWRSSIPGNRTSERIQKWAWNLMERLFHCSFRGKVGCWTVGGELGHYQIP